MEENKCLCFQCTNKACLKGKEHTIIKGKSNELIKQGKYKEANTQAIIESGLLDEKFR